MVERSLKLDALNLNWLGVIDRPPLMENLEKNTFKPCTPTMKKNGETTGYLICIMPSLYELCLAKYLITLVEI